MSVMVDAGLHPKDALLNMAGVAGQPLRCWFIDAQGRQGQPGLCPGFGKVLACNRL